MGCPTLAHMSLYVDNIRVMYLRVMYTIVSQKWLIKIRNRTPNELFHYKENYCSIDKY